MSQSSSFTKVIIFFLTRGNTNQAPTHNTNPLLKHRGEQIMFKIGLQLLVFSGMRHCENLSDILTIYTEKCDGSDHSRGRSWRLCPDSPFWQNPAASLLEMLSHWLVLHDCAINKGKGQHSHPLEENNCDRWGLNSWQSLWLPVFLMA